MGMIKHRCPICKKVKRYSHSPNTKICGLCLDKELIKRFIRLFVFIADEAGKGLINGTGKEDTTKR